MNVYRMLEKLGFKLSGRKLDLDFDQVTVRGSTVLCGTAQSRYPLARGVKLPAIADVPTGSAARTGENAEAINKILAVLEAQGLTSDELEGTGSNEEENADEGGDEGEEADVSDDKSPAEG